MRGWVVHYRLDSMQRGWMVSSTVSSWKLQPGHRAKHSPHNDIGGPVCSSVCATVCNKLEREVEKYRKNKIRIQVEKDKLHVK